MNRVCTVTGVLFLLLIQTPLNAQWKNVKRHLQKGSVVTHESKEKLIIFCESLDDSLVFLREQSLDCDIYERIALHRGGNPYQVWYATKRFWNNPDLPKSLWTRFFKPGFLSLLRPPEKEQPER